jgi:hypothetical protein
METFEELLAELGRSGVRFILVGGLAVALCGYVRTTMDVDILVEASKENVVRLLDSLRSFGEGSARELSPDEFTLEEGAIRVIEHFTLDLFTVMSGKTYADLLPLTETHEAGGASIRYLGPEGLLILKKPSLRPQDQLDVLALTEILRSRGREA